MIHFIRSFLTLYLLFFAGGGILPSTLYAQDVRDSPFGFHPGNANQYQYIGDLGASYSRDASYIVWDWVDVNRDGHFSFKDATAPAKPGVPNSGGSINYDTQLLNIPDDVIIVKNISPFRNGGEFTSETEKQQYFAFVKATVERYDGDDDPGCPLSFPDAYFVGDNDHPSQQLLDRLKRNPIKYWQVCNQLHDACAENCRDTYAQKYAEVLRLTYLAVKAADSTAQVLIAGDSHMTEYPSVFNELNGKYIDIVDMHRFGTEDQYDPEDQFNYITSALRNAAYDSTDIRIWITETGTYSGDPVPKESGNGIDRPFQNEKQQAGGLIKFYISAFSHGVEKVFWAWNIVEGFQRNGSIFDYTGLVYDGFEWTGMSEDDPGGKYSNDPADIVYDKGAGVKKLAYYACKLMIDKLENGNWDDLTIVSNGSKDIYAYKFTNSDGSIWVLWWDWYSDPGYSEGDTSSFDLDVGRADSVVITKSIPNAESGNELQEAAYPGFFSTHTQSVDNDNVTVPLGKEPVYVEAASPVTSIENHDEPTVYKPGSCLHAGFPNPFNSRTRLRYNLRTSGNVTLSVYNVSGQEVAALVDTFQSAGEHEITWEAEGLSSGIYFYKLEAGAYSETLKILLQK